MAVLSLGQYFYQYTMLRNDGQFVSVEEINKFVLSTLRKLGCQVERSKVTYRRYE